MLDVSIDLGLVGTGTVTASEQKEKKMSENSSRVQRLQIPGGKNSRQRSHGMGCRCLRWASESLRRGHLNKTVGVKPCWLRRVSFSGLCKAKGKGSEIQGPLEGGQSRWSGAETPGCAE